jgi:atypical dual specificity phosphatase
MNSNIPSSWIHYKPYGNIITGTKLIPFKVPLNKHVQRLHNIMDIWDCAAVINQIPNLCAVIDLTYTYAYYKPYVFNKYNIIYKKIPLKYNAIPSKKQINMFIRTIDYILDNYDGIIGIHCTHGINRTGYMICCYLIKKYNMSVCEAIHRFESARGYKIYRMYHVNDLYKKYGYDVLIHK